MALARRIAPAPELAELFPRVAARLFGGDPLAAVRERAWRRFLEQGLPSVKVESWKYSRIPQRVNRPMGLARPETPPAALVREHLAGGPHARRLVFSNGIAVPSLAHLGGLPEGMRVLTLEEAAARFPERVAEALGRIEDDRGFTDLNTALCTSGAWIELDEGVAPVWPLQLLFVAMGGESAAMTHPRVVVRLGRGARLHLIENHASGRAGAVFTNAVLQAEVGEQAQLVFERAVMADAAQTLVEEAVFDLSAGARLQLNGAVLGGGLVRSEYEVHFRGEGGEALLGGLYVPRGREHVDTTVRVFHHVGGCHSDQFFKGVLEEQAHAVFAGRIAVAPGAQRTDAYQVNRNLLLSDEAEVDTRPELQIEADDVRCTHGATVGRLDAEALFYLRARGLAKELAEAMLTYAFAAEVVERIADADLARQLSRAILARVPGGGRLEVEGLLEEAGA